MNIRVIKNLIVICDVTSRITLAFLLNFFYWDFQALDILDEVGDLLKLKYSRLKRQPALAESDNKELKNGTRNTRYSFQQEFFLVYETILFL